MTKATELTASAVSNFKNAGLFMIISGVLHLPMFLLGGFSQKTIALFVIGIVWILLGVGLRRQKRYLPCICYVAMLIGVIASMAGLNAGPVPNWWWWLIFAADLLAAFFLFRLIWSKP